jgi:hypothetical protein
MTDLTHLPIGIIFDDPDIDPDDPNADTRVVILTDPGLPKDVFDALNELVQIGSTPNHRTRARLIELLNTYHPRGGITYRMAKTVWYSDYPIALLLEELNDHVFGKGYVVMHVGRVEPQAFPDRP